MLRVVAVWLGMMVLAIANGGLRELLISPRLGIKVAHVASTILLCAVIVFITWISMGWIGIHHVADTWKVGVLWVMLTLGFEFLAGHFLFGHSWAKLAADYNLLRGRIWVLVPIVTLFAPRVALAVSSYRI